jgi:hypothetical protein
MLWGGGARRPRIGKMFGRKSGGVQSAAEISHVQNFPQTERVPSIPCASGSASLAMLAAMRRASSGVGSLGAHVLTQSPRRQAVGAALAHQGRVLWRS